MDGRLALPPSRRWYHFIRAHYDSDFKSCYKSYGVQGAANFGSLEI